MPVVTVVSQATRPVGSWRSTSSRTASEIWSATLSGWPSVTDSDVNRWTSRSLIVRTSGLAAGSTAANATKLIKNGSTDRPARHHAIEQCRKGVEGGQGDVLAPGLEPSRERAGDAAAAAGAGDGERDLRAVEAGDDAVRDLDGAARAPRLAQRAAHHRPVADQVALLAVDLERLDAAFVGDVEMVGAAEALLQLDHVLAGLPHHLLVGDEQPHRLLVHRL